MVPLTSKEAEAVPVNCRDPVAWTVAVNTCSTIGTLEVTPARGAVMEAAAPALAGLVNVVNAEVCLAGKSAEAEALTGITAPLPFAFPETVNPTAKP